MFGRETPVEVEFDQIENYNQLIWKNIEQQKDEILLLLLSWFSVKIMWSRFIALISSRNVYEWEGKTEP